MTLKEWRKQENRSMLWIAKQLKYKSASTIHGLINGKPITTEQVKAIEKLTKGKVKYKDWVGE